MNVAKISNSVNDWTYQNKISDKIRQSTDNQLSGSDSVEISTDYHEEDSLFVNKSGNNIIIHIINDEILQRTIERGFLMVDETKINLSDDDKAKLAEVGEKVKQSNEKSYMKALMSSNLEVERHNSEVMDRITRKENRLMNTAARIMKGERVSVEDEQELMLSDPKLYAIVKSAGSMHKTGDENTKTSRKNHYERIKDSEPLNYDTSIPEYKKFETQMVLSRAENDFEVKAITAIAIN